MVQLTDAPALYIVFGNFGGVLPLEDLDRCYLTVGLVQLMGLSADHKVNKGTGASPSYRVTSNPRRVVVLAGDGCAACGCSYPQCAYFKYVHLPCLVCE